MRKIKRLIALVTVAMFLLSLAPVGALAATKEDAFYRLNGLGVAFGDQNGDPMFDKNYTRAEAAALMVQLSGMGSAIDAAKGATKFSDVPASHWASGVINLAVGAGIIKGYPNGTYKPEAPVSYAEMCAMLIQVLGYGPKLQGTWPANVIGKAAELDLLDGVSVTSYNSPAIRGMVFIAADNALDTNILEEDKDGYTEGGTLIDEKFDSKIYDEEDYTVKDWEVDGDGQFVLTLNGDDPFTTATTVVDFDITLAKKAVVEGGTSPSLLTNQLVNFVWNDEDDEATYVRVVSTKIKSDDVSKDGDKLKVDGTSYKYDSAYAYTYAGEAAGVYNDFYSVYLNDDGKIYLIEKNVAGSPKMVDELKADKTLEYMDSGSVDLDEDDVLVIKDGKVAKVEDLKQTDIVYVTEDDFGLDVYVDAYSLKNEGKFEAAMNTKGDATFDQVKIGGKKFDIAADLKISSDNGDSWTNLSSSVDLFDDVYDETVKFGLNKAGDVSFILTDAKADSKAIYAIVDDADTTSKGLITKLDVMTSEGKEVSYDVDTNEIELDYNNDSASYTGEDLLVADDDFIKITLDANGKINDVDAVTDVKNITDAVEDLNKLKAGGIWYYTNSATKVINANGGDDAEVVAAADLLDYVENNGTPIAVNGAYVKLDGTKVVFVLIDETSITATAEDKSMVLDKYYRDGKYYAIVDVRGTESTYEISGNTIYNDVYADELYEYKMDGSKIEIVTTADVDIDVNFDVYGEITDVEADSKSIEISDTKANLSVDADTYIYDMTGDDPVYVSDFSTISEGDYVFAIEVTGDDDRRGVADVIVIVDDEDYPGKNFETGFVAP